MPFVAELYFDSTTEERIREAWHALDKAGISDSMPKGGYRPHISLGICEHLELDAFAKELSTFAETFAPFRLSFPNIGIFSTSEGVVYWGATATTQLLNVHTAFHEIFKKYAKEQREYYTVGQWVPHCTLAFGLSEDQIAEAVTVCRQIDLPVSTEVKGIGLVEVSPTGCRMLSSFSLKTSDSSELNDELTLRVRRNTTKKRRSGEIREAQAAEMRARLASFAEDWESLEMDVYDNYDEEKAKLQTRC